MGRSKIKDDSYNYLIETNRGTMWLNGWTLNKIDKDDKFLWVLENKEIKYRDALWSMKKQASTYTPGQLLANLDIKIQTNQVKVPYNPHWAPGKEDPGYEEWKKARKKS